MLDHGFVGKLDQWFWECESLMVVRGRIALSIVVLRMLELAERGMYQGPQTSAISSHKNECYDKSVMR